MKSVLKFLGISCALISCSMLLAVPWGLIVKDGGAAPLFFSMSCGLSLSAALLMAGGKAEISSMTKGEARLCVIAAWMLFGAVASLPYIFSGSVDSIADALFEGISGITTTGASVLRDLEAVPRSILFWRCLSQWIGGMGIAVLMVWLFPASSAGAEMFSAEVTGPSKERVTPRIQQTAGYMWRSYMLLTAAETAILIAFCGLSPFDAITLALCTVATGGFSPYPDNLAHFSNGAVLAVVGVFLFLSACNLSLFYVRFLTRRTASFLTNSEFKFYASLLLTFGALVTIILYRSGMYDSISSAAYESFFHTASMLSTCGFYVSDYGAWPASARHLMLILMLIGGCAVSTSGGVTCLRALVVIRHARREYVRILHPRAVTPLRLAGGAADDEMISSCFAYVFSYIGVFLFGLCSLSLLGMDISSALSCSAATLGNVGPGFGIVGPSSGYAELGGPAKVVCMTLMLLGRLEIYTLFSFFARRRDCC